MISIVQHAPRFSAQDAVRIAHDNFGLDVSARQLPSERDQNFHLTCQTGKQYVLKVANATERIEVLEFQNRVMMHIASNKNRLKHNVAAAPEVCQSIDGKQIRRRGFSEAIAQGVGGPKPKIASYIDRAYQDHLEGIIRLLSLDGG